MYKILVVEDNKILNQYIGDMVDWQSMNMEIAGNAFNGEQGLHMAMELKPDLVIADIDMPKIDGLKMCKLIKEQLPDVRFVFISCFDSFQYVRDAMDLGAYKYMLKPVMPSDLVTAVQELSDIKSEHLITKKTIEDLQGQIKANMPILQVQFFREVIHTLDLSKCDEIRSRMRFLQIHEDSKQVIISIEADNFEQTATAENWYLLRAGIEHELKQLTDSGRYYVVDSLVGSLVVVICFQHESSIGENILLEKIDVLTRSVKDKFNRPLTVILSDFCSLFDLREQCIKVRNAVASRFYSGGNHVVIAGKLEMQPPEIELSVVLEDVKQVFNSLSNESIETFISKYYTTNSQSYSEYMRLQSIAILTSMQIMLLEKNFTFERIMGSNTIALEKLNKANSILDLRQWMHNIFNAIKETLTKNDESGRNEKIVFEIKSRIEINYSKYFGPNDITSDLQISTSHANYIFKQRMGMTIFDYLVRTKMEVAMSMLKDPFVRVYEVAAAVGYESISHFISVFKTHTGMTPKQFSNKA